MKVILQRAINACVEIESKINGKIDNGFMALVAFTQNDNLDTVKKLAYKISNLRVFEDENGKLNKNIKDVGGAILSISQFTLYADCKNGHRPSFTKALNYTDATILYDLFNEELRKYDIKVETGIFGSNMNVSFTNQGPVTIILDSEEL